MRYEETTSEQKALYFMSRVGSVLSQPGPGLKDFIIQQMHKYIIRRYNKNYYKIFKIAPCFGSQGIHHQGALYSAWLKLQ